MDEQRMIEIETRLAYQEQALAELNDALTGQQGQLDRLARLTGNLEARIVALAEAAAARSEAADERPPHY